MMFYMHVVVSSLVALLIALSFLSIYRKKTKPWSNFFLFFFLVFLISWAAGVWVTPFGGILLGVYWMPMFFTGFLFALLLVAIAPEGSTKEIDQPVDQTRVEKSVKYSLTTGIGSLLWIFMLFIIMAIVAHYTVYQAI